MDKKNLPLYDIDTATLVWRFVSLVDAPAIEVDFIKLARNDEVEMRMAVNEEKREVMGPVAIPGQKIYRRDERGEYYIRFGEAEVKQLALRFFAQGKENAGNVQHSADFEGITFYQSFLIDKERGVVPTEFADLPDGTWILAAKIDNDKVWDLVKSGEIRGFSLDATAKFKEEKPLSSLEEFLDYINK